MGLETATYIDGLVASNPALGDPVSAGDDHLRLLKAVIKASFPNIAGAVSASHTELSYVAGVTSGVQGQLDGKAAATHTHTEADISDGTVFPRIDSVELITGDWVFDKHTVFEDGLWAKQGALGYAGVLSAAGAAEPIRIRYENLDYAAGGREWLDYFSPTYWVFGPLADDFSTNKVVFGAWRNGNVVVNIEYGNATDLPSHNFRGAAQFNNGLVATAAAIGSVTDAEIQRLAGVSSSIQTQLNGKAATSHSHTGYAALSSSSFTATLASASSGGTTYATGTAYWQKVGNLVTITFPTSFEVAALDGATFVFVRGLPAEIRSACALLQRVNLPILQAGYYENGQAEIFTGSVDYMRIKPSGSGAWEVSPGTLCGPAQGSTFTYRVAD